MGALVEAARNRYHHRCSSFCWVHLCRWSHRRSRCKAPPTRTGSIMHQRTIYIENRLFMQEFAQAPIVLLRESKFNGRRLCAQLYSATRIVNGRNGTLIWRKSTESRNVWHRNVARTQILRQQERFVQKFLCSNCHAQQCNESTNGARALHSKRAPSEQKANYSATSCKRGVHQNVLTHRRCMEYTTRALYTVSALTSAQCSYIVCCKFTHRCIRHVKFTVLLLSQLHAATAVYDVISLSDAVCKFIVNCHCSERWTVHP